MDIKSNSLIHFISNQTSLDPQIQTATLDECINYLSNLKEIAIDTETEGLWNAKNKILMLQVGDNQRQFVIDVRNVDISPLKSILENPAIVKILWNASFDYKFLRMHDIMLNNIWDGQLVEMVLTTGKNESVSLETACLKYLNIQLDKTVRSSFNSFTKEFTYKQIAYGAEDIANLIQIKILQEKELKLHDLERTASLENKFVTVLADMEYNGFYLDRDKWLKLDQFNINQLQKCQEDLNNYVIRHNHSQFIDSQLDFFSDAKKVLINWGSSMQVIKYLNFLGIDTTVVDKGKVKQSADAKNLLKFKKHEFVQLYLKYKKKEKEVSTYGTSFLQFVNPVTKRIHSSYWQIVDTGRMSSSKPNLQNIPNTSEYRHCFVGQNDNVLVVADFSAQEQRVLADRCKDPALLDFYQNGDGDMHCLIARRIYPELKDVSTNDIKAHHNDKRQFAKIIGFTLNYGGGAYTVAERLQIPIEEAEVLVNNYFKGFPKMTAYFKYVTKETMKNGYILIDKISKRKVYLSNHEEFKALDALTKEEGFWDSYRANKQAYKTEVQRYFILKGEIERASQNYPIQGTSGSITKLAGIYLKEELIKQNLYDKVLIVNIVHDEIVCETSPEYANQVSDILSKVMEKAGSIFCKTVSMPVTAKISKHWTH